jgi:all-trans-8'-apo-beta-carotenal 15,15'-oxygenase
MMSQEFREASLRADQVVWGKADAPGEYFQAQKDAWFAAFRSQPEEFSYEITGITGPIPTALRGSTLLRNGPGRFERGPQRVNHYLDGDGYLCRITLTPEGRAFFTSKFVTTAEFSQEAAADRFLFRSTFGTAKPGGWSANMFEVYLKNPANTHIVPWGDRWLALYEAGLPYRIDPASLQTIGAETLDGSAIAEPLPTSRLSALRQMGQGWQGVTAHPHIDPCRDRLVIWRWRIQTHLRGPNELIIEITEYDRQWQPQARQQYAMPGAAVNPHDFALTPSYYVFFENSMEFTVQPFLLGYRSPADCLCWRSEQPTKVHLVPRPDGPQAHTAARVENTVPWFAIHQACAWDRPDGGVEIYSTGWPATGTTHGFLTSWGGYAPDFAAIAPTFLWRTQISPEPPSPGADPVDHRVVTSLENCCIDHPHLNPAQETQAVRYLYMTYSNAVGESSPPVGYLKLDLVTGERQIWLGALDCFTEEPLFVAEPDSDREDDGYLLGLVYDHCQEKSALLIFDARDISLGPVCRLGFSHHLVHGLHGSWVSGVYQS